MSQTRSECQKITTHDLLHVMPQHADSQPPIEIPVRSDQVKSKQRCTKNSIDCLMLMPYACHCHESRKACITRGGIPGVFSYSSILYTPPSRPSTSWPTLTLQRTHILREGYPRDASATSTAATQGQGERSGVGEREERAKKGFFAGLSKTRELISEKY
jgi:hypothetical protein